MSSSSFFLVCGLIAATGESAPSLTAEEEGNKTSLRFYFDDFEVDWQVFIVYWRVNQSDVLSSLTLTKPVPI